MYCVPPEEMTSCWTNASSALACSAAGRPCTYVVADFAANALIPARSVGAGVVGEACTAAAVPTVISPIASAPAAVTKRGENFKGAPLPKVARPAAVAVGGRLKLDVKD